MRSPLLQLHHMPCTCIYEMNRVWTPSTMRFFGCSPTTLSSCQSCVYMIDVRMFLDGKTYAQVALSCSYAQKYGKRSKCVMCAGGQVKSAPLLVVGSRIGGLVVEEGVSHSPSTRTRDPFGSKSKSRLRTTNSVWPA